MDGFFYARIAYEAYRSAGETFLPAWEDLSARSREAWRAAADAVLRGGSPVASTLPPSSPLGDLEDLVNDPDSSPTPCETPDAKHKE